MSSEAETKGVHPTFCPLGGSVRTSWLEGGRGPRLLFPCDPPASPFPAKPTSSVTTVPGVAMGSESPRTQGSDVCSPVGGGRSL